MGNAESTRERLRALSPEQREQLLERVRSERLALAERVGIPRHATDEPSAPLSFPQQHMWLHQRLSPESAAYHMPLAVRLKGALDLRALAESLGDLLQRHAVLRTVYRDQAGEVVQVTLPPSPVELPLDVAEGSSSEARESAALSTGRAEVMRPFDLERGPVLRARVIRLAVDEHILLLTVHHIAADGWSLGILAREMSVFYRARKRAAGEPAVLPPPAIRYTDFARWQRSEASSTRTAGMLDYFRAKLSGAAQLELPLDRPRPSRRSSSSAQLAVEIKEPLGRQLQSLADGAGASPFMVLLATLQLLLAKYSNQDDVTIGSPIANRALPEVRDVVGLFVNMLALRADLSRVGSFSALLAQTKQTALEAYERQELPFERVVDAIGRERDDSRSALFQALLVLLNTPSISANVEGLQISPVVVESGAADHDLVLTLAPQGDGYQGALHYNGSLWDGATMRRLLGHYLELLEAVTRNPDLRLDHVRLCGGEDERQIAAWNQTSRAFAGEEPVHRSFERRAAETPEATALRSEGRNVSYGLLNGAANRLARDLMTMGVRRGSVVGIALPRSPELVLSVLATLKAGAAYLPIDPEWPERRVEAALVEARACVLVASSSLQPRVPANIERLVLAEERAWSSPLAQNPSGALCAADLAYVIATSGSTGAPKAAMNTHGALTNRLCWQQLEIPIEPLDRVLYKTPATFDVSVWELLWPLQQGATMVIARPEGHREADYLAELVRREAVTVAHFVPSMLEAFVEMLRLAPVDSLRVVIASGEVLAAPLIARFHELTTSARLYNLYGPSEAGIDVTCFPCLRSDVRQVVPIGRPIANTQIRIVDKTLSPVPVGVPGEICIAGRNVGRGYASRPEWTAERFVPDAFAAQPGSVMYRTGDLGRWRADGNIEYIGRRDQQVKVRGHRIELGELEAAVLRAPFVRAVAASVHVASGDPELLLHVVWAEPGASSERELREFLRSELPSSMQPAQIVALQTMPLTSSGKIDRRALPAPQRAQPRAPGRLETELEREVARLWLEVLGSGAVPDQYANFFELGGHSISLARLGARFKLVFGVEVPLRSLFDAPSLDAMCDALSLAMLERVPGHQREQLLTEVEALANDEVARCLQAEGWL